jgi:hypothetical protein
MVAFGIIRRLTHFKTHFSLLFTKRWSTDAFSLHLVPFDPEIVYTFKLKENKSKNDEEHDQICIVDECTSG